MSNIGYEGRAEVKYFMASFKDVVMIEGDVVLCSSDRGWMERKREHNGLGNRSALPHYICLKDIQCSGIY